MAHDLQGYHEPHTLRAGILMVLVRNNPSVQTGLLRGLGMTSTHALALMHGCFYPHDSIEE